MKDSNKISSKREEIFLSFNLGFQLYFNQCNFFLPTDHTCGYCSLLPNLLKGFGWNPGKRMLRWFGEQLKERTGDGDITFKEVSCSNNLQI